MCGPHELPIVTRGDATTHYGSFLCSTSPGVALRGRTSAAGPSGRPWRGEDGAIERGIGPSARSRRGRTRITHLECRFPSPGVSLSRNQMARKSRSGCRSQRRTFDVRAGSAAAKTGPNRSTALRAQVCSGSTSTLPTTRGLQPSSRASVGHSRRLRSIFDSRSCRSTSFVLTSTIRRARAGGYQPITSIDPCSPQTLKLCSGMVSQPSEVRRRTTSLTRPAWSSSRSLARSAPRHRGTT